MAARTSTRLDAFRVVLGIILVGVSIWAAILPVSRFDWFIENVLVWIAVILLVRFGEALRTSSASYLLITIFLLVQIYASHYAYLPPMGNWISSLFGSSRNSFDRVVHLLFGVLLFIPIMECFQEAVGMSRKTAMFCSVLAIAAFGASYEVVEWVMVVLLNPEAGAEFIGLQGDPWDAQKDLALAIFGSVMTYVVVSIWQRVR